MKILIPYDKDRHDFIRITWYLLTKCNLRCSYCHRQSEGYETNFDINEFNRILGYLENTKVPVDIELLGGEVTLIKNLEDCVNRLNEVCNEIMITSNGVLYKKLMDLKCELLITLHTEYITDKYLEGIKELIEYRLSNNLNIDFTTVLTTSNSEIVERLKKFIEPYMASGVEFDVLSNVFENIGAQKAQDKEFIIYDTRAKTKIPAELPKDRNFFGRMCMRNNLFIKDGYFGYVCDWVPIAPVEQLKDFTPKMHRCEFKKCQVCCDDKAIIAL